MLLRQFISQNAIEEIYIVKTEDDEIMEGPPLQLMTTNEPDHVPPGPSAIEQKPSNIEKDDMSEDNSFEDDFLDDFELPVTGVKKENESPRKTRRKLKKSTEQQPLNEEEEDDLKCYICMNVLSSQDNLKKHLKDTHADILPFKCDRCVSSEVKNLYSLNKHYEMHDSSREFKCLYCEARFLSRIHRTAHQRRYHKDELENDTIRNMNRRFVCRYCNKRFAAKFNLERHERNHEVKISDDETFLNRKNKCYICDTLYISKEQLNAHLCVHADQLPFTCNQCDPSVTITSTRLLSKHLALHGEERPIKCVYCDLRFISVVSCQAHERTHAAQKEADETEVARLESEKFATKIKIVNGVKRYECQYCGNSYSLLSTLRRHENIHTGQKQYICKACGKNFSKSSCLLQHERTHSDNAPYKCTSCGRGFKETIRLIEHRRIHTGEKPFSCNICFKTFRIKPLLKEHKLQCSMSDEMKACRKCRFCDSIFPKHKDVIDHIMKDHQVKIVETKCNYCDLKFKDAVRLADHENNHTNPNSIECPECGRIFKQHSNLRRHLRLHSNDSVPYTCDICAKSFSQAGAMKVHRRIHTGEKPYTCELCSKSFYHSSTMNRHKRSHFKTNSKLYLFGLTNPSATNEDDEEEEEDMDSPPLYIDTKPNLSITDLSEEDNLLDDDNLIMSGANLLLMNHQIQIQIDEKPDQLMQHTNQSDE